MDINYFSNAYNNDLFKALGQFWMSGNYKVCTTQSERFNGSIVTQWYAQELEQIYYPYCPYCLPPTSGEQAGNKQQDTQTNRAVNSSRAK